MNKEELRNAKQVEGWRVPPVSAWKRKGKGKTLKTKKGKANKKEITYELEVVNPEGAVGIVEVLVVDEDKINEVGRNIETVTPQSWEVFVQPFDIALRDYLATLEGGNIECIEVTNVNTIDLVARVLVYNRVKENVDVTEAVVCYRNGQFILSNIISKK